MLLKTQKKLTLLFLLSAGISSGCKKNSPVNAGVPNVAVNATVNVSTNASLQTIGGWGYVFGGYDNIIVFCNAQDSYLAFDRGCPYDCTTNSKAVLNVQAGGITAKCPVCGTTYSLYSGTITSNGPGTLALKQYTINYSNYPPLIYISN
jgi:hypothetical protein